MRVKNLFLCCHNIFSVNELFTELCFRGRFRIEKEPLRAFAIDDFCEAGRAKKIVGQAPCLPIRNSGKRRACPTILASKQRFVSYFDLASSAVANFCRPSRICARVHAANPKVRAGFI